MPYQQAQRQVSIKTPLEDDKLLFHRMRGREELGRLFQYDIDLLSDDGSIAIDEVLGKTMTVRLTLGDEDRFFNGYVTEFRQVGTKGKLFLYQVTLRPWLWFLTRTSDCRIFGDSKPVAEIVKDVFREYGFTAFADELQDKYKPWDHCVQYRETDFNFVSRLLEHEGIYYYFQHTEDKHTLVLCDAYDSHKATSSYEEIPYFPPDNTEDRERDHIYEWTLTRQIQPGMYAVSDFDFMRPKADLQFKATLPREHEQSEYEMFDYPGEFVEPADGEKDDKEGNEDLKEAYKRTARLRIEELHTRFEVIQGEGNARGLQAGALFTLLQHPREDQNREYLLTSTVHRIESDEYRSEGAPQVVYVCSFGAIEAKQPFRPARATPKPLIQGPQTAIVVGPEGQKVHTDKYGRARVQFHWDRYGQRDQESSCWVRVSQNWAGDSWGAMFLPHVGQEVIVEFLEGDPDRPIITGRVYNEDNMPPLDLPAEDHKSIIRDHYGNELVMDGTEGNEHIVLRSPHHDSGFCLGKSAATWTVSDSRTVTIGNAESTTIGDKKSITRGLNESYTFGSSFGLGVGNSVSVFGGGKFDLMVGASISFSLAAKVDMSAGTKVSYFKGSDVTLGSADFIKSVDGNITLDSNKTLALVAGDFDQSRVVMDKESIQIIYGKGDKAKEAETLRNGFRNALIAAGAYAATVAGTAVGDMASLDNEKELLTEMEDAGLITTQEDKDKVKQLKAEQWTFGRMWQAWSAAGAAVVVPVVLKGLDLWKKRKKVEAENSDNTADKAKEKHAILHLDKEKAQLQSGEEQFLQLNKTEKSASLYAGTQVNIVAGDTVYIGSKNDKPVTIKANELQIKAVIAHKSLKVTE